MAVINGTEMEELLAQRVPAAYPAVAGQKQASDKHEAAQPLSRINKLQLKLLISMILLASLFLFGKVDLAKIWETAAHANCLFLASAAIIFFLSVLIGARRWQLLAAAVGLPRPLYLLTQYCYVGLFFNLFLPSTVGGDFSRCYYLGKGSGRASQAFYSVLADRYLGIAVLFLFASAGLALAPQASGLPWQLKAPIFAGGLVVFALVPFVPKLSRLVLGEQNWLSRQLNSSAAKVYWQDKGLLAACFSWSIALQLVMVAVHIAIGFSLGLTNIPLWYYLIFYPSVAVMGFITPSFNGIGIREWAYTYFLTLMGVARAQALTYALIWLGLTTLISLAGGLVYLAGHFQISRQEVDAFEHEPLF